MKLQYKRSFFCMTLVCVVLRFLGFGFIIYDSLFRICYKPAYKGDYGIFALIGNLYAFFDDAGKWIYVLGCTLFPLLLVGSILWLKACTKAMPEISLSKYVYYLSIFVLVMGLVVFAAGVVANDFKIEIILRSAFIAVIVLFLIADVWNTALLYRKQRNDIL